MSNIISLEDFNANFTTSIRNIEKDHKDETGTYSYSVGFNVLCTPNNRTMYFEAHLDSNQAPPGTPESVVTNMAWLNLLPDVKTWASSVLTANSLLGSVYIPTIDFTNTSNINLSTFNSNFTTNVSRFEVYPKIAPSSWCVGYNVFKNTNSNDTMYYDTSVNVPTFAIQKSESEIMDIAWSNLKESVGHWAGLKLNTSQLLNTEVITTNW